jgi:hypothetical protein
VWAVQVAVQALGKELQVLAVRAAVLVSDKALAAHMADYTAGNTDNYCNCYSHCYKCRSLCNFCLYCNPDLPKRWPKPVSC